jgi:catechol 2,3-dioxygenase-like lactoylglutathione lyase family enzyme
MDQRVSLITLGVADLEKAVAFYEALGWLPGNDFREQGVAFFQANCIVFALWDRGELAADCCVEDAGGWGGSATAYNCRDKAEVDAVMVEAEAAGARIARPAAETPWGGYSGVFVDPDGHAWEVAHNPHWTILESGAVSMA